MKAGFRQVRGCCMQPSCRLVLSCTGVGGFPPPALRTLSCDSCLTTNQATKSGAQVPGLGRHNKPHMLHRQHWVGRLQYLFSKFYVSVVLCQRSLKVEIVAWFVWRPVVRKDGGFGRC